MKSSKHNFFSVIKNKKNVKDWILLFSFLLLCQIGKACSQVLPIKMNGCQLLCLLYRCVYGGGWGSEVKHTLNLGSGTFEFTDPEQVNLESICFQSSRFRLVPSQSLHSLNASVAESQWQLPTRERQSTHLLSGKNLCKQRTKASWEEIADE